MHIYASTLIAIVVWAFVVMFSPDKALAVLTAPLTISAVALAMCALPSRAVGVLGSAAGRVAQYHVLAISTIIGAVLLVAGGALVLA